MVSNAWLVVIITESTIEEKVLKLIKSLGVKGYTVYRGVTGEGDRGVRSGSGGIGTYGDNVRIDTIISSEAAADTIMREIHDNIFQNYAGIVYVSAVRVIRVNKFMTRASE